MNALGWNSKWKYILCDDFFVLVCDFVVKCISFPWFDFHIRFWVSHCAFSAFDSDQESCSDNNAGCTHGCIQGPFGAQCTCPVGYQLSNDSKTCEDVDECNPPGLCSQHCFNERGSFRCHCQDGYTLEADQRTCKASGEEGYKLNLLWMEHIAPPGSSEKHPMIL